MTTSPQFYDFEQPLADIHKRLVALRGLTDDAAASAAEKNIPAEIERLEVKYATLARKIYRNLSAWQTVQVARHPERPQPQHYMAALLTDFTELKGDRRFGNDDTLWGGLGKFNGQPVVAMGIRKGTNTTERMAYNFGMPRPEGYRKAQRLYKLADQFGLPILTFIDTPGAFPGVDAEERGQGQAIAECLEVLLNVNVPVIATITGEGGSGGALALAVADKVLMLQNSIYSVISPEGCAGILWKKADRETTPQAAEALNLTASRLHELNLIDHVIKEPVGGAHANKDLVFQRMAKAIAAALNETKTNKHTRREKFLKLN